MPPDAAHAPLHPSDRRWSLSHAVAAWIADLGDMVITWVAAIGDIMMFGGRTFLWLVSRMPRRETLLPNFYQIGVLSLPVVALTGTFIGMVLAVQSYSQFRIVHLETRLGAIINMSLVRELGPVLAATMLAGRVGSAMAAELGTMRVTEQIDALSSMGANPVQYLVVPRFIGCLVLIPTLTIMADFMGVVGGWFYSTQLLGIDNHHYWENAQEFVGAFDLFGGVFKSLFFGAAIALISCHRGFHCDPGAEGVGRAAYRRVRQLVRRDPDAGLFLGHHARFDLLLPLAARDIIAVSTLPLKAKESDRNLVEVHDLHVQFGRQRVLRGINLDVPRGQTLGLIGESGCGKTVLLKTIIGLVHPTRGEVLFDGVNLAKVGDRELTRQRIRFGFLFQQAALFDSMNVEQNVAFPLRQHTKKSSEEIRRIVVDRLAEVGLPSTATCEKAGRAFRRHAETRRPGAGPGARSRDHAVRRADDRTGPDHERRHQRIDHSHSSALHRDQHRRHA